MIRKSMILVFALAGMLAYTLGIRSTFEQIDFVPVDKSPTMFRLRFTEQLVQMVVSLGRLAEDRFSGRLVAKYYVEPDFRVWQTYVQPGSGQRMRGLFQGRDVTRLPGVTLWRWSFTGVTRFDWKPAYKLEVWTNPNSTNGTVLAAAVVMPYWLVAILLSMYPILAFIRGPLRRYTRRKRGECVRCGYNLTGLPEPRCPECGTPIGRTP